MLSRAEALIPNLKVRAQETEHLGRLTPATIETLHKTGLFGMSHISLSWDVMGSEYGTYAVGLGGNPAL
ncbi:MAG: hypothetical protein VYE18_08725, partial [Pseudomonadota bacterium]|nr:hypothetical protein [Pseudomonadota bacterium]